MEFFKAMLFLFLILPQTSFANNKNHIFRKLINTHMREIASDLSGTAQVKSVAQCGMMCLRNDDCESANFVELSAVDGFGCNMFRRNRASLRRVAGSTYIYKQIEHCDMFNVSNPSFEHAGEAWRDTLDGAEYTTETSSHGSYSVKVTNGGVYQVFTLPVGTRRLRIDVDSKGVNTSSWSTGACTYCIYCDIKLVNGEWEYGVTAQFDDNTDWHTASLVYTANQAIDQGWCHLLYRYRSTGLAYFDNVRMWTTTQETAGGC